MSDWTADIRERLAHLTLRPEREVEIIEELSQHLDDQVRERIAAGMAADEARREALADLDASGELTRGLRETEATKSTLTPGAPLHGFWLSQLWQDVRLAVRSLRRRPWFAVAALATLALTIGPTTAIVSVGNWLLWTPSYAIAEPDRLVVIWTGQWRGVSSVSPRDLSYPNLADVRETSRTLAAIAGWQESSLSLTASGQKPVATQGGFVTANFFDVLGIRLAAGRTFRTDEDRPPFGAPVAILSHAYARQAFGSPALALQQTVHLNGRPMTVVGVAPPGFTGAAPTSLVEVWYPGSAYTYVNHFEGESAQRFNGREAGLFYTFIGRLAPGVTAAATQAELDILIPQLVARYPKENEELQRAQARVFPGLGPRELMRPQMARLINGLLIVAGILLLLGCANVSNLLLSEGVRARTDHAIRLALGASRGRLIRQMITESVVLSVTGAVLGVALAVWLKQAIQVWMLPGIDLLPVLPSVPLDRIVLSITLGAAMACGMVAGVAPAWLGTRAAMRRGVTRDGRRVATHGHRARTALAAVQLALSLVLVTGATLMVGTLRNLSQVDLGFASDGVAVQSLSLRSHGYSPDRSRAYNVELATRVREDPSFDAVSLATGYPFGYSRLERIQRPNGTEKDTIDVRAVATDEHFPEVFGLRLLHGRYLRSDEVLKAARQTGDPVVVSESLARVLYGRTSVIGEPLIAPPTRTSPTRTLTIVGVMRDTRTGSLTRDGDPLLYWPLSGEDFLGLQTMLVVRSRLSLASVGAAIERQALQLDATLPPGPTRSLRQWVDRSVANTRVFANVLLLLAVIGLVLAAVGLYGLLSQAVGERRRELGIRLAIGASTRDIASLIARQTGWISTFGVFAGLLLSYWGTGLVKSYLVGVSESDPRVYASTVAFLLFVVVIAAARPAWAATRVNPVETLRAE